MLLVKTTTSISTLRTQTQCLSIHLLARIRLRILNKLKSMANTIRARCWTRLLILPIKILVGMSKSCSKDMAWHNSKRFQNQSSLFKCRAKTLLALASSRFQKECRVKSRINRKRKRRVRIKHTSKRNGRISTLGMRVPQMTCHH